MYPSVCQFFFSTSVFQVFFSHEKGITTVLSVEADLSETSSADVGITIEHVEVLEGSPLYLFLILQGLLLTNVGLASIDQVLAARTLLKKIREENSMPLQKSLQILVELTTAFMIASFTLLTLPSKVNSARFALQNSGGSVRNIDP